jgi:hypothetical protein
MARNEAGRRRQRQPNRKSFCTSKNTRDLQNRQSPWVNPPPYDPVADIIRRVEEDAGRDDATSADDQAWFDENPARRLHIRNATPHELDAGLACSWMLVAKSSIGRMRLPVPFPALAAHDALEHDTEEKARELFEWLTWGWTAENMHPFPFSVLQEIRGARHG